MVKFYIISTIQQDLDNYLKCDLYASCKYDLCNFFKNKRIEEIFSLPILVAPNDNFRFIKSRIANSKTTNGKSGGYRVYFCVDLSKETVYFIGFYPKNGKYGKTDLLKEELKKLLNKFNEEKQKEKLIQVDINNNMQEVKSQDTILKSK